MYPEHAGLRYRSDAAPGQDICLILLKHVSRAPASRDLRKKILCRRLSLMCQKLEFPLQTQCLVSVGKMKAALVFALGLLAVAGALRPQISQDHDAYLLDAQVFVAWVRLYKFVP